MSTWKRNGFHLISIALFGMVLSMPGSLTVRAQTNLNGVLTGRLGPLSGGLPPGTNGSRVLPQVDLAELRHPARVVADAGAHHRSWRVVETNRLGAGLAHGREIVEVCSGLNYFSNGAWLPSHAFFEVSPEGDAYVANHVHNRIRLAADLNSVGAVTMMHEGVVIRSTPAAVALFDSASGRFQIVGVVTNSEPVLVATNRVVYENCFSGISADIIYSLDRGVFEQDLVFRCRFSLADLAARYAFPTNVNTVRLQVITEFFGCPEPERVVRPIYTEASQLIRSRRVEPDLIDEQIRFGGLVISAGHAFMTPRAPDSIGPGTVVAKAFRTISGRTFLIESTEYQPLSANLEGLPDCGGGSAWLNLPSSPSLVAGLAAVPKPPDQGVLAGTIRPLSGELASLESGTRLGVCIDYPVQIGPGTLSSAVFQGDTTYFISGACYCNGTTTIEGGAVFKYPTSTGQYPTTAYLQINGPLILRGAGEYRPITFTAADDLGFGENIDLNIWPYYTGTILNGTYYANPAVFLDNSSSSLAFAHFRYCQEGVRLSGTLASSFAVSHSQFLMCIRGISLQSGSGGCGGGCGCGGCGTFLTAHNVLMSHVQAPVWSSISFPTYFVNLYHCTFDAAGSGASQPAIVTGGYGTVYFNSCNCIFDGFYARTAGNAYYFNGANNGFYACQALVPFGTGPIVVPGGSTSPFQAAGSGSYYLAAGSPFRTAGTTSLPPGTGDYLKTRSTTPPTLLPLGLKVSESLVLSPQVPRYLPGTYPDIGFWYDAVDYSIANLFSEGGQVSVKPGTVVAVRDDRDDQDQSVQTFTGFVLRENSTFVSHGTPESPNVFTTVRAVQEGPVPVSSHKWNLLFLTDFEAYHDSTWYMDRPPLLSFRFTKFAVPEQDYVLACGPIDSDLPYKNPNNGWYYASASAFWSLRDCEVRGGQILAAPSLSRYQWFPAGGGSLVNNLLECVYTALCPTWFVMEQVNNWSLLINVDFSFSAYNNLLRGGHLELDSNPSSAGNWVFRDNALDGVTTVQYSEAPLDHDYNAYLNTTELTPVGTDGGPPDASHDQILQSGLVYQTGPFGDCYLPAGTLNADSGRTTVQAGLSQYTTRFDQAGDGTQVRIGLHYVATSGGTSSVPLDTDNDGIQDYVSDANGNGISDWNEDRTQPGPLAVVSQANNDFFQIQAGCAETTLNVLPNDFDSRGFPFQIVYPCGTISTPHGSVRPSDDGLSLLYTPKNGFTGVDKVVYAAVNDLDIVSSALVQVFVNDSGNHPPVAGNHPPVAVADQATMGSTQTSISINLTANDTDQDVGDQANLQVVFVGIPQLGSRTLTGNTIVYTRDVSLAGLDTFAYGVTDGRGGLSIGTIQIDRQTSGDHAPVAVSYATTAVVGAPLTVKLFASDQDGDSLTYAIIDGPHHGTLDTTALPEIVYTSDQNYFGPDYIKFQARESSGALASSPAVITVHVQLANSAPSATPVSVLAYEGLSVDIIPLGWDNDGDYLTYEPYTAPSHGSLTLGAGKWTYTPITGYTGPDTFTFTAFDGKALSTAATVCINIVPPPMHTTVAIDDVFPVDQNSFANTLDVLVNDSDSDGYPLVITAVTGPSHGTVTISSDSLSLVYRPSGDTPPGGYYGQDAFTYSISNGHGRSSTGNVKIFVNKAGNGPPFADNPNYAAILARGQTTIQFTALDLLQQWTDSGDTLSLEPVGTPRLGTLSRTGDQFTYVRSPHSYGTDTFGYRVLDSNGGYANGGYDEGSIAISQIDTDGDGLPDAWELDHGYNPDQFDDLAADSDNDGLRLLDEYRLGTDPLASDNPLNFGLSQGANVSGVVTIALAVRPDLDPRTSITLCVNGAAMDCATVHRRADGAWEAMLDTTSLANGQYLLSLMYRHPEEDCLALGVLPNYIFGSAQTIQVNNAVTFDSFRTVLSSALYVRAKANILADGYEICLFNSADALIKTIHGDITGQAIDTTWDLTDGQGHVVVDGPLRAEVSLLYSQGGQGKIMGVEEIHLGRVITRIPDQRFVLAYGFAEMGDPNDQRRIQDAVVRRIVNFLGDYILLPSGNVPYSSAYVLRDTFNSKQTLLKALQQGDNFFWFGHGFTDGIYAGGSGGGYYPDFDAHYGVKASEIARYLGNDPTPTQPPHSLRLVILDGCYTYTPELAKAFGIGPFTPKASYPWGDPSKPPRSAWTVADYEALGQAPRAFVGWPDVVSSPRYSGSFDAYCYSFETLFDYWMAGYPLYRCMMFYDSTVWYDNELSYGISGCIDLTRLDFE